MKKTKILIGAFLLVALFSANTFAQTDMRNSILALGEDMGQTLSKQLNQIKQEQKPTGFITKMNLKPIYLGDSFASKSSAETFKLVLPESLKSSLLPEQDTWTKDGIYFMIEAKFPYLYITVKSDGKEVPMVVSAVISEANFTNYSQEMLEEMRKELANRTDVTLEEFSTNALLLTYKVNDKEFKRYLGIYQPTSYLTKLNKNVTEQPLGKTFTITNYENRFAVSIPGQYEATREYWDTREYLSFRLVNSFYNAATDTTDLILSIYNDNPLVKQVPIQITEEDCKVFLSYKIDNTNHIKTDKKLIAIGK